MKLKLKILTIFLTLGVTHGIQAAEPIPDNPYECNHEELRVFIENKMEGMQKGANSGESWNNFKVAYAEAATAAGDDGCAPFWETTDFSGMGEGFMDAVDQIGGFIGDPTSILDAMAERLAQQMTTMVNSIVEQLKKGICERLSEDFIAGQLQDTAGEYVDEEYGLDIDFSEGNIMEQLMDETVCNSAGNNPLGGTLDAGLQTADDGLNTAFQTTDIDFLSYGDESCDLFLPGSGDPDKPNEADEIRAEKAEDVVDKEFDKLDAFLWD